MFSIFLTAVLLFQQSSPLEAYAHIDTANREPDSVLDKYPIDYDESMKLYQKSPSADTSRGVAIPGMARLQLKSLLVQGIEAAEVEVLSMLDELRNRKFMKIGRQEWIVVGICLMRLLLVYRDFVLYYAISAQDGSTRRRLASSITMYDSLTAVYGATFHNTISPLSSAWNIQENNDILGEDQSLMTIMENIRISYKAFTAANLRPEDARFKHLIIEPEIKREKNRKRKRQ